MEGQLYSQQHQHNNQRQQHLVRQHQENPIFQQQDCLSATDHWGWEAVLVQCHQYQILDQHRQLHRRHQLHYHHQTCPRLIQHQCR